MMLLLKDPVESFLLFAHLNSFKHTSFTEEKSMEFLRLFSQYVGLYLVIISKWLPDSDQHKRWNIRWWMTKA